MSSMFQEVAATGAYQRLRLEEYDHQVSTKNRLIKDIQKSNFLDDARTRLKNAQDELVAAQGYIHHLEIELHKRDEQLEVSQA
jgi:hypothetical protein